jgi:predicted amidohydrolase
MINLVAVQAEMSLGDYASAEVFRQKVFGLTQDAVAGLPTHPTLVAFPELIGFPLLLTLQGKGANLSATIKNVLSHHWKKLLQAPWQYKYLGPSLIYLPFALPTYRVYVSAFSEAAKTFGVTIVAGSSLLPYISHEPALGLHIADPKVYNRSLTFGPNGKIIGQTQKVHLTPGLESRLGIERGRLQDLQVMHTPVGKVGVAICLDAFHDSVIGHLDGLGAEIIIQPTANNAPWDRPWPNDNAFTEGEAWMRYGLKETLRESLNVRYGVNPMLVGDLWELKFEGVSSIVQAAGSEVTVIAQAKGVKQDVVKATVDVQNDKR